MNENTLEGEGTAGDILFPSLTAIEYISQVDILNS